MPDHDVRLQLIDRFYSALAKGDAGTMAACYHKQVHFSDPVFDLHGRAAGEMWRMLCSQGRDLRISHDPPRLEGSTVRVRWQARYTFSGTGRKVHNVIEARFKFDGGLIVRHADRFSFWRWSRQALGPIGWLLGWSGALRSKIRRKAARSLAEFSAGPGRSDRHAVRERDVQEGWRQQ